MRRRVIPGSLPHRTWGSSCIERSISRRRRLITHVQRNSPKDSNDTAGHGGGNDSGDEDAKRDGGEGCPEPEVQHIGHQGAGPGPGPRQRDCHEDDQADGAILFHDSALEVCPALQPVDFRSNPAGFAQPVKNTAEQKNEKGDWNEIAEDGGSRRCGWRQGRRLYRPELHRAAPAQAPWQ